MGNVGDEFPLVLLRVFNLAGHIFEGGGQIAQFVITFDIELIMIVAGRELLRGPDDLAQGPVDKLCKEDQDDQREKKD